MRKDETGYIVVETLTSFMLFVFFVTSILSLINIVVVQARVHYALTQTATSLSMYDYCLHVTGLDDRINDSAKRSEEMRASVDEFEKNIQNVMNGLSQLAGGDTESVDYAGVWQSGSEAVDTVYGWVDTIVHHPAEAIGMVLTYASDDISAAAFEAVVRPVVGRYLTNGPLSGDEYLKQMNVIDGLSGLEITGSILDSNGDVAITVNYDIAYKFGTLPLPFGPKLSIEQTVVTKAWLGGDGQGFQFTN